MERAFPPDQGLATTIKQRWRARGILLAMCHPGLVPVSYTHLDPAKEKLYYDAAFDLIKSKDFDKASQAFNAFLRKYPNSQYSGNAQYWLGEDVYKRQGYA